MFSSYVDVILAEEDVLRTRLEEGNLDAYLFVPAGFAEGLMNMEHLPMKAVVSMRQPTKALVFSQVLSAYETYIKTVEVGCSVLYDRMREEGFSQEELSKANMEISIDLIFTALGKDDFFRVRSVERETEVSLFHHYVFTAMFFAVVFCYLPAGLRILKLRKNGMLLRLRTMQVPAGKVLLATAIPYVFGTMVFATAGLWLFGKFSGLTLLLATGLCLTILFLILFLSALVQKRKDYLFAFSMLLIVLAVPGGGIVTKQYLPDAFARLTEVFPNENFVLLLTGNLDRTAECAVIVFAVIAVLFVLTVLRLEKRGEAQRDA
jgi:ABC-2 type transport system permease protein